MRKILWILLIIAIGISLMGCRNGQVIYDESLDSFMYKPESQWDYFKVL